MNNTFKVLTLCSSVALLLGTAQVAHAHAGFKDQITEGTVGTWNAVKIGHGCATNVSGEGAVGTKYPRRQRIFTSYSSDRNSQTRERRNAGGRTLATRFNELATRTRSRSSGTDGP